MRELDQQSELKTIRRLQRRDVPRAVVASGGERPPPDQSREIAQVEIPLELEYM